MTPDIDPGVGEPVAEWARRLVATTPGAVAVFLKGSRARGEAGRYSDVDLDVVTAGAPRREYRTDIVERAGRLVHLSASVRDAGSWRERETQPQDWALLLPAVEAARGLWFADDGWRARLDREGLAHPGGGGELEDFVEALAKVANAALAGDDLGVRLAAQVMARRVPSLLQYVNPPVRVGTTREAVAATLAFPAHPDRYREDLVTCWGLSGDPTTSAAVAAAAHRLATGLIGLLGTRIGDDHPGALGPDELAALRDGRWRRYVAQLGAAIVGR